MNRAPLWCRPASKQGWDRPSVGDPHGEPTLWPEAKGARRQSRASRYRLEQPYGLVSFFGSGSASMKTSEIEPVCGGE